MSNRFIFLLILSTLLTKFSLVWAIQPAVFPQKKIIQPIPKRMTKEPLTPGYKKFRFKMDRLEVLKLISADPLIRAYDADFIIGFEKEEWRVLVTIGYPYMNNIYFLFNDDKKLYEIIIVFNRTHFSYLEVMNALKKKYQHPNVLGQDVIIWQDDKTRIQLESTVHLKYLDLEMFKKMKKDFDANLLKKKLDKQKAFEGL